MAQICANWLTNNLLSYPTRQFIYCPANLFENALSTEMGKITPGESDSEFLRV